MMSGGGMMGMSLIGLLTVIVLVLGLVAVLKYLRSRPK